MTNFVSEPPHNEEMNHEAESEKSQIQEEEDCKSEEVDPYMQTPCVVRPNSFEDFHLSKPLLQACEALGYTKPTFIQTACIPFALTGSNICGSGLTGSGKTPAFALPILERLLNRPKNRPAVRAMILTPTTELAVQIHGIIEKLSQFMTDIRCCVIVGDLSVEVEEAALKELPDIVVATPGCMIDRLRNSTSVRLDELAVLILDEADQLLELGFSAQISELVKLCPKRVQTMIFSANEEVDELVTLYLNKPAVSFGAYPMQFS